MHAEAESRVKLVGLLEAMGMALPEATGRSRGVSPSITDTRLPVGFDDDEFGDHEDAAPVFDDQEHHPGGGTVGAALDEPRRSTRAVGSAVVQQRRPAAGDDFARNRGTWEWARTEPNAVHRPARSRSARTRNHGGAYYRSEHARITAMDDEPAPAAPRFPMISYHGRHRRLGH
ncbi:hypothetical protein [Dactylosporangium sp. NPDC051541]|uniref:hypothetical protein n=1 Tax=Dactylosporangium sp. NPDC051541 TaxID=3363977 RepID=UPI0037A7F47A